MTGYRCLLDMDDTVLSIPPSRGWNVMLEVDKNERCCFLKVTSPVSWTLTGKRKGYPAIHGFIIKNCRKKTIQNSIRRSSKIVKQPLKYFISLKDKKCGLYPVLRSDAVRQLLVIWVWCWQHSNYNAGALPHSHTTGWWIGDVIGGDRTRPRHLIGQDSRVQARRSKPQMAKLITSLTEVVRGHGTLKSKEIKKCSNDKKKVQSFHTKQV
jgi:hypothetical protein